MTPSGTPPRAVRAGTIAAGALLAHTVVNARLLRRPPATRPASRRVSVLVPARDEADRIGPCVRSLLASDWHDLQILVLDDRSTDGTAAVVRRVAGDDPRVQVLTGAPTPPGWLGKPWACAQLGDAADGEVLVFVDADVVLATHAVASCVALLDAGLDVASPYPRQVAEGALPRLIQPLLQWSWLTFLPLRIAETSARPSLTAANGQVLACGARAYEKLGGHAAARDEVLDDLAIARAAKRVGLRAGVADGTTLATCHMYRSADALVAGYTKNLWSAFGSPAGAVGITAVLAWMYIHPVVALLRALSRGDRATARLAGLGYGLGVAGRMVAASRTGGNTADAMTHPLSIAVLAWLTARSVWSHRRGTLEWRGRPVVTGRTQQESGTGRRK